jgi:hypothetical protein
VLSTKQEGRGERLVEGREEERKGRGDERVVRTDVEEGFVLVGRGGGSVNDEKGLERPEEINRERGKEEGRRTR